MIKLKTLTAIALAGSLALTVGCSAIKKEIECPLWGRERENCLQQNRHPSYENNKHEAPFRWAYNMDNSELKYFE
ncbi:MAG: hypothetical protein AABX93_02765 [Nanoarchaeota archaeon]